MPRAVKSILAALVFAVVALSYVQTQATPNHGQSSPRQASYPNSANARVGPVVSHIPVAGLDASAQREVVKTYCVTCHSDRRRTGGLTLESADLERVASNSELWEKVVHKLRTNEMPPARMPRPDAAVLNAFASSLETVLDAAAVTHPNPGGVGLHRLNRTEYANAIRDLLALEINEESLLLPDEADEGFDNLAASLTLSPAHLERYLSAAKTISRLVIGDPTMAADFSLHKVPRALVQDRRVSDDLPFGSAGGTAIEHRFPVDAEYVIKIRLRRQLYDYIMGLGSPHQLDVRVDGTRVKRFTVGGDSKGIPGPRTFVGEFVGDPEWETYMHTADEGLEVRLPVSAGTRSVGVSFVARPAEPEGVPQSAQKYFGRSTDEEYDGHPAVENVSIAGPYIAAGSGDTPSRRAVLSCRPSNAADRACPKTILSALARHAYRRPVTEEELQTLLTFYDAGCRQGGFEAGIQSALTRLLVSFNFLFRIESDPPKPAPGTVHRLSDFELASRLSFFLWSSIPDDVLLDVAARGRLKEPAVLEQQVRRMLADGRSKALVGNFSSQWLTFRKALTWRPDPDLHPEFDENLREAFLQETTLFVEDQFRQDRSVVDLLSANYTFVNERLARHYGMSRIYGDRFRRVTFEDGLRGGLLGQGSILMVTSYPDRTSPVLRGKWLLDNILGMPPPPPPPDVPTLGSPREGGRVLSVREQMEEHRKNPACAACHVRMDPLGFSLENFDAVGQWRTKSGDLPVDAAAVFADGTTFEGIVGLRRLVLSHRENFAATMTSKLVTYALGRALESDDYPAVRAITRQAAVRDYRWSSIILGIVNSVPFQMRKTTS